MTDAPAIPNLWPADIAVAVLPPFVILKAQAANLRAATKGVIEAEVTTTRGAEDFQIHRLDLVPVQLDKSRHRVLTVTHRTDFYPAVVEARVFEPLPKPTPSHFEAHIAAHNAALQAVIGGTPAPRPWPDPEGWKPIAASQEQLLELLGKVLRSIPVRALLESLLARSYEQKLVAETATSPAA